MTTHHTFHKIRYKRHYFSFPVLIALCVTFLGANLHNLYHHQNIILNLILALFFATCLFKLALYFTRLLNLRRPYIKLTIEQIEYANIWNKKCFIRFEQISKTDLSIHSFQNNHCIDLNIYIWNHQLQRNTGFGNHIRVLQIRITPEEYENLNIDFISLVSILKMQTLQQRYQYLKQLNLDQTVNLKQFMTPSQQVIYKQNKFILIHHKFS